MHCIHVINFDYPKFSCNIKVFGTNSFSRLFQLDQVCTNFKFSLARQNCRLRTDALFYFFAKFIAQCDKLITSNFGVHLHSRIPKISKGLN